MAEEYIESENGLHRAAAGPLFVILAPGPFFLGAFLLSYLTSLYGVISDRNQVMKTYNAEARRWCPRRKLCRPRLRSLINDLLVTSSKDANAAQVIREAKQAGILRDAPPTNAPAADH